MLNWPMGRYRIREIDCLRYGRALIIVICIVAPMTLSSCKPSGSGRAVAPESSQSLRPLNLVVVTIDTLRADRLHCYGNGNIDTPTLDGLAQRGAQFENAVAQAPLTPPSHASIFTGTNPNVHQVRNTGGFVLKSSAVTLAKILKAQGWDTAAFVGASVLKRAFGFSPGFDVYDDQMPKSEKSREDREYPERRASVVVDHALNWLNSQSGKPFFIWVHLYDPHEPYDPPQPFREKYRKNLYDGEVAYTDQQLGRLLAAVGKKAPAEKTVTVVLADHGESLGEHGEFNHGVFLYDSTLRIPLLMAGPGIPAVKVTQQVRTIDVLPTILDLMGGKPPAACQGTTLTPSFRGKHVTTTYSYEETLYPKMNMGWAELRGVRTDRWKYVRAPKPELYDLLHDPGEKNNVIDAHPEELRRLESQLEALTRANLEGDKKVSSGQVDSRTMEQLKSLGYLSGVASGEFQLNGKGIDPKDRTATLLAFQTVLGPGSRALSPTRRIEVLREALAGDSTNPSLYFYLAAEYEKAGRYDQALVTCKNAQQHGVWSGRLLSRMGDLYVRDGKKEEAIAAYEKAAQYNPSDVESQTNLGTAYLEEGKIADAERCFRWALTIEEYAPACNGLGLVAIQRQQSASARAYFERAVALDPNLVEARLNLGLIYKMAGDIPRAKACFEAFLARASHAQYGKIIPQVKQELEAMP
ncbi:MAG: tetratricopeptide repeat protein [Acidobacteriota bacterium]|nr:tetratricopeptide repeat protein [Acidobacteriota bacterium]